MTDFAGFTGAWGRRLLFYVGMVPAVIVLILRVAHLASDGEGSESLLPGVLGGAAVCVIVITVTLMFVARTVKVTGQDNYALISAQWNATAGLARYIRARDISFDGDRRAPQYGTLVASTDGLRLGRLSSLDGVAWPWASIHSIDEGRVLSSAGAVTHGIIVTVEGPEGRDRVPVIVVPNPLLPFPRTRATSAFVERLREVRRQVEALTPPAPSPSTGVAPDR